MSKIREAVGQVRSLPRWMVLRLATVSGVSAGWWIMAFAAAVAGAVAAIAVTTLVHVSLKGRPGTYQVPSRVE